MPILLECPLSIKRYIKFVETFNDEVFCPCCGRKLRKHGKYNKTIHFKHRSFRIPIMRRRFPDCRKAFSLMPCFTSPWARFANHIYEFLGRWLMEGVPWPVGPKAYDSFCFRGLFKNIIPLETPISGILGEMVD
ncbi:DUF6431 domain-containing protein [Heyndrickxia coagulans]|uniref:DUF6431 domain-containing protein n=1 Tax=Heyndrickxia coagulans TaxID=1398 RepID=UPI003F5A6379